MFGSPKGGVSRESLRRSLKQTLLVPPRYGDMRRLIGFSIRDMWYKLGE